jgi:hypothetical protein
MAHAVKRMYPSETLVRSLIIDTSGWYEPHQVLEAQDVNTATSPTARR